MLDALVKAWREDDGAVTVDWVVLTAAIVGLAVVAVQPVAYSTENVTDVTKERITNIEVGYQSQN